MLQISTPNTVPAVRPARSALTPEDLETSIFVDGDEQIRAPLYAQNVALGFLATGLSRRRFVDWAHERLVTCEKTLRWPDGRPYTLSETPIDEVFGDGEDESFRWLSELAKKAAQPSRRKTPERLIERYRRLGLALRLGLGAPFDRLIGAPLLSVSLT